MASAGDDTAALGCIERLSRGDLDEADSDPILRFYFPTDGRLRRTRDSKSRRVSGVCRVCRRRNPYLEIATMGLVGCRVRTVNSFPGGVGRN